MDIEKLKLILEAVGAATDTAKTVAIWYFIMSILPYILTCGTVITLAIIITRMVVRLKMPDESHFQLDLKQQAFEAIRKSWLYGQGGADSEQYKLYKAAKEILHVRE
jgi:hypothetical protein